MGARKKSKVDKSNTTFNASDAKANFGKVLDSARVNPVTIEKHGRPFAVVISAEEFDRLEALEDSWLGQQADLAMKEGTRGKAQSEKKLAKWLNAK